MKKIPPKTQKWYYLSIPILFFFGSIFHFLYDLSGNSPIIGAISAVNESVWEHQKMVLLPVTSWWVLYFLIKGKKNQINKRNWFTGLAASLGVSILAIPFSFYFYSGAFGVSLIIVDVFILLLAVAAGQCIGIHLYKHSTGLPLYASIILIILIILIFIIFTFNAPHLPWFRDSMTGRYGM
ncbi:DUF6512 family protein [Parasporobacterium paucivorans]|uniref:Uncharacterized protein n=1 Tax=Parasporobacterium paucivorans DSM 15970 TaxID=1122934 RepID=A0A1M6JYR2_9FIRM|nr:DUF6512 family protein [Parasporobacterium paucivorans]SHJ51814.1 hypothetical protein SAMN02745691_02090 [Parasporobacterium paucivorans DSM 15970]